MSLAKAYLYVGSSSKHKIAWGKLSLSNGTIVGQFDAEKHDFEAMLDIWKSRYEIIFPT
jgi:hypothetical protein